jgi:hypothetical protein
VGVLVGLEGDVVKTLTSIKKGIAMLDERRALIEGEDGVDGTADGEAGLREDEAAEPSHNSR